VLQVFGIVACLIWLLLIGDTVKRILIAVAGLLLLLAFSAEGCETTTTSTADAPASSGDSDEKAKAKTAGVGDSVTLKDSDDQPMKITLVKVIDPVSAGEYDEPQHGRRYVGIKIKMTNKGDSTYDDSPSNGAHLIDTHDEQWDSTIVSGGPCGGQAASSTTISPGAKRNLCIPFEVGKKRKLKTFQFSLDSGFGPQAGEWNLRQ
jgi:hypothetical protein